MKKTLSLIAAYALCCLSALAQWTKPVPAFSPMPQDGETVMYLYNVEFGGYFLGANEWSTRASLSVTKGYKLKLVFQFVEGAWAIIDSVETQGAWKATFCDNPQSIWVDNNAGANWDQWVFSALGENTYEITNSAVGTSKLGATEYYDGTAGDNRLYLLDYTIMGENNQPIMSGNAYTTWAFVSESDYRDWRSELATYNAALTLGNYISASEANFPDIDLSAPKAVYNNTSSTLNELNAALTNARDIVYQYQFGGSSLGEGVDYTDRITNPDFAGGSTAGWSDGFTVSSAYENAECYFKNFHIYQSLTGLPAGTYRVSVQGFYRQGTAAEDYEVNVLQTSPWFNAKIFATNSSNTEVTAPIMCLSDGRVKENLGNGSTTMPDGYYAPNTMESARTWFDAGYYKPNSQYNSVMAEVLDDGLLTIGVQKSITINADWAIFDNFTLTYYGDAGGATTDSALARYNVAVENAKAVIADEANAAAVDEIAALQQLIDAEIPSTASEIEAAREAIEAATSAVISASAVKNYEKILTAYPQDVSGNVAGLALWAGDMVTNSGQHWDGTTTSVYYEQTGDQWLQSSWTNSKTMSSTFPPGKYVICMAGRAASGENIKAYLRVNDQEVVFPSKGDVGLGVDVNGVATMSSSATYANDGKGRGWEYRYVEFVSDGQTPTTFTIGGKATASHQWMSFTEPQFRTTADNEGSPLYPALTNADFMADAPETVGVRTYEKDVTGAGEKAQNQPVTAWTINGFGDAHAAGTFQYGSEAFLGGEGYLPPATDPKGNPGQALGLLAVWGATTQYTQHISLPAGTHTLIFNIYNAGGTGAVAKNLFGVNENYIDATTFPVGQWSSQAISFELADSSIVTISLGYQAGSAGSASMPHLFVDGVVLEGLSEDTLHTIPFVAIADSGLNVIDFGSMNIDWSNLSDSDFVAAVRSLTLNNAEALMVPSKCIERLAPYLDRDHCPNLLDIVIDETTLPLAQMENVPTTPNLMIRMPEGTIVQDASGQSVAAPANIFIGRTAEKVVLTDGSPYLTGFSYQGGNYFAKRLEFTRSFSKQTRIGQSAGWETLVLPFNVANVQTADGRTLVPFGSQTEGDAYFWLAELTAEGVFQLTDNIKANTPYIIAMPNSEEYDPAYNITGDVTFSATNDTLYLSQLARSASGRNLTISPVYAETDGTNVYAINDEAVQGYMPGGAFVRSLRTVRPFEAYLTVETMETRAKQRDIIPLSLFEDATAILRLKPDGATPADETIYDLTGRRVLAPSKGLYIVNGQKTLYK